MNRALVLVWLGTSASQTEHARDLESWARSRVVTIESAQSVPSRRLPYDPAAVSTIERLLAGARTAVDAGDPAAAKRQLEDAETLVLNHPELPQGAWLMAEIWHIEAELLRQDAPERAAELERRATALSGPRARTYSARSELEQGVEATRADVPTIVLTGPRSSDAVYVDGLLLGRERRIPIGLHHVRVLRQGEPVFTDWVHARTEPAVVRLEVARPTPCSAEDLGASIASGKRPVPNEEVACPRWAVARPTADGIEVAMCFESRCGTFLAWKRDWGAVLSGPPQPGPEPSTVPAWLGWTLAGAAVIAGGSFVAWQAGAFDSPGRGPTTVRFNGPDG